MFCRLLDKKYLPDKDSATAHLMNKRYKDFARLHFSISPEIVFE